MNKLIFCDLDGTLLDDNKNIIDKNTELINKLAYKNCKFIISSGRSNMSIDYFNSFLNLDKSENYTVAFNGAYIYKTNTKEKIIEHLIPSNLALQAIKICKNFNVDVMVYKKELLWFDNLSENVSMYAKRNMVDYKKVSSIEKVADESVSKVIVIGENNDLKLLENYILKNNINKVMTTFFSAKNLYEFNPYGIDKGTGIEELASYLNINIENTIAIGDNYNDLSMIKKAGIGVCCKNGECGVKKYADYITKNDNNTGAVAEVIEKFILN